MKKNKVYLPSLKNITSDVFTVVLTAALIAIVTFGMETGATYLIAQIL